MPMSPTHPNQPGSRSLGVGPRRRERIEQQASERVIAGYERAMTTYNADMHLSLRFHVAFHNLLARLSARQLLDTLHAVVFLLQMTLVEQQTGTQARVADVTEEPDLREQRRPRAVRPAVSAGVEPRTLGIVLTG